MRHSGIQVSQVSQRAGAADRPAKEQVPDTLAATLAWQFETQSCLNLFERRSSIKLPLLDSLGNPVCSQSFNYSNGSHFEYNTKSIDFADFALREVGNKLLALGVPTAGDLPSVCSW